MNADEPLPPFPLRRLGRLVRPHLGPLLLATLILILSSAAGLAGPLLAGAVVDAALSLSSLSLQAVGLWLIGLFAVMGVLSFAQIYLLSSASARLLADLRGVLFSHLVRLPPAFHEQRRVGELLSRLGSDLSDLQSAITMQIPSGLRAVLGLIGTLVLLLILHTRLTLLTLAVVPPVMLLAVWTGGKLEKFATRVHDALADSQAISGEALDGLRTVQAFAREEHEIHRHGARLTEWLGLELARTRLVAVFHGLLQFAAFTAFAGVLWYGASLIRTGELTAGELTTFLLYTFSVAMSVGTLGVLFTSYREMKGASARVFHILDTEPAIKDPETPVSLGRPTGRVAFEQVRFSYPSSEGRAAISAVDLSVAPGEMVALVGPSGAGKSTLFWLLLRFYDPDAGRVLLDGHDLRTLKLDELRGAIGLVPQDIFLFSASVEENLRYGKPDATPEQIRAAAEAAGAARFIQELAHGYEEKVGERGVKLSVGQRQRLAIARAFLKDPALLLLDEATSALDAESEEVIQLALAVLQKGRTTLVIAHRLATARRANRILVLEQGRIQASGTHEELFAANALYKRYWELQSLGSSEERTKD